MQGYGDGGNVECSRSTAPNKAIMLRAEGRTTVELLLLLCVYSILSKRSRKDPRHG